uniref:ERCC4 domain-containing protein n=1 Tax=viral metagenome TaxID=1070528 RepID=A0A6C0J3H6_9ZZZZ
MLSLLLYCREPIMKIIIDERETALFEQCETLIRNSHTPSYIQLSKDVLNLGDILLKTDEDKDVLLIERKTYPDLLSSIKDGRYEEQSYRLANASGFPPHSIFYLIEGVNSQLYSSLEKKIAFSAITTLQFFKGFSVHRTSSIKDSAEWLLYLSEKIERNFIKGVVPYYLTHPFLKLFKHDREPESSESTLDGNCQENENIFNTELTNKLKPADYCNVVKKVKKDNVTPGNIGEIILCQIPGISSITAIAIMKHFDNFPDFINKITNNIQCIENLTMETNGKVRKISKKAIESIQTFLLNQEPITP